MASLWCAGGRPLGELVGEEADGGRFEIVELTAAGRPGERERRKEREQHRERQDDEEDAHGDAPSARSSKVRDRRACVTTVSEESGISTAARSGETSPAMHSPTPTTL